jgi:autotransporter-associated beta strand protein
MHSYLNTTASITAIPAAVPSRCLNEKANRVGESRSLMRLAALFLALGALLPSSPALGGDATWLAVPGTGDWNTAGNWTPNTVPNGSSDTATFSLSGTTAVSLSASTEVSSVGFDPGASAFTITVTPTRTLTISDTGISNASGITQSFVTTTNGAGNRGTINFTNSATAGSMTSFTNNGAALNGVTLGGFTQFFNNSNAGSATITNFGGTVPGASGGVTRFYNNASAANATLTHNGATVSFAFGSETYFYDTSTAANATITNNGDTVSNSFGSYTQFRDNSTAASATITNNGATFAGARNGGFTLFYNNSTAADATITNNGNPLSGPLYASGVEFRDTSTAGNATLISNGGTGGGLGGVTYFSQNSTGGTATVKLFGNGGLDITGHNAPGVTIGSLEGTGQVFLGARNLTVGSNNLSTTFSGVIADAGGFVGGTGGSLTKIGTGTLTLSGVNTYTGDTNINEGVLIVDGSIASANTFVNPGGTLGGIGTLFGNVVNSGIVTPGGTPGALNIGGNYTQNSNGTLVIEVASASSHDRLDIAGGASLDGTLRVVRLNGYQPTIPTRIVFLTAGGGVSGTFATENNDFGPQPGNLVRLDVDYSSPNEVALVAAQNSFSNALAIITDSDNPFHVRMTEDMAPFSLFEGITPNQISVALALDSALYDARQLEVLRYLDGLNINLVPHELDKIAPDELTAIYTIGFAQMQAQVLSVEQRLADIRHGVPNPASAPPQSLGTEGGKAISPVESARGNRFGSFITQTGNFTTQGGTPNANGYDVDTGGTALGFDYMVSDTLTVGMSLGYAVTSSDLVDDGEIKVDGGRAALYGQYYDHGFFVEGLLGGGFNSYETKRSALQGIAKAGTQGGELDAAATFGYDAKLGGLTVTPLAGLLYTLVGIRGADESGSLQPLHFENQSESSLRGRIGVRASFDGKCGAATVTPSLSAEWQRQFDGTELAFDSRFANGAGAPFTVHGPKTGSDSALLTAALNIGWSRYAGYLAYQADLGRKNYESQNVLAGFRVAW